MTTSQSLEMKRQEQYDIPSFSWVFFPYSDETIQLFLKYTTRALISYTDIVLSTYSEVKSLSTFKINYFLLSRYMNALTSNEDSQSSLRRHFACTHDSLGSQFIYRHFYNWTRYITSDKCEQWIWKDVGGKFCRIFGAVFQDYLGGTCGNRGQDFLS